MTSAAPDDRLWLHKPFKLTISITATCNQACRVCYADCGTAQRKELTPDEWIAFIDQLAGDGIMSVFFEGGEPLLLPDFDRIAAHAARKMLVGLRTNGTLIDPERARRLKEIGVGRVYVDLFGATAAVHDDLAGKAGSHEAALAGLRNLKQVGIRSTILVILNRLNAAGLPDILTMAPELGADQLGVLRLYPLGRAKRAWSELALSMDEMTRTLASLDPPPGVKLMQSWHPNDGNCCWQNAAVDPFGNSIGCPYLREYVNYGNILEKTFRETWNHPLYRQLRNGPVDEGCPECSRTQLTHGGCRSTAYAFTGSFSAADPFCSHLNRGVDLRVLPEPHARPQSDGGAPADA